MDSDIAIAAGVIGASLPRKEDGPLLRGRAEFVDDISRPDALHACVVRSSQAHARLLSLELDEARRVEGVVDVLTASDLPDVLVPIRVHPLPGLNRYTQPPLARGKVRYVGEPVAIVIADSRYSAEDAAELVWVDYEPLDPVLDGDRATESGGPLLHEETGTNLAAAFTVEYGEVDALFAAAALVVEERFECQRHSSVPLETRGLVAEYDEPADRLTVWGAAKIVQANRHILAALLDRPVETIRLVEPHVGGGFGGRGEFYPEDYLIPYCAIRLRRPVAWTEDRSEHLHASNHSREQIHELAMALDADGRFLALRDRLTNDTGAYVRTHGAAVPAVSAGLLPGPYVWPAYRCEVRHVVTNKTPSGTYRAPGRYEGNFARERLIDIAARKLGRDPLELRRQNLVPADAIPYASGAHTDGDPVVYESGDYHLMVEKSAERFDYDELVRWRNEDAGMRYRRGLGIGLFVEKSGIGCWDYARVELDGEGRTVVYAGAASVGQGVETALAQVCAEALGVAYESVAVRHGDTATVPEGGGAFGSRTSMLTGMAVHEAATALRDLVANGGVGPLMAEATYECEGVSYPYGVHFAAVEVDLDTGGVRVDRYCVGYDVGRAINPLLVEGQIVGGVAQGIGGALFEELAYDENGQLVTGSFMDYLLPTAVEVPHVDVLVTEDAPTPLNPLGVKGAGEGGTAAVGAAISNAVSDALGAEATRLPLTPERVLELAARGASA